MTDIRCIWGRGQHIISFFYISTFVDLEIQKDIGLA